MSASRYPPPLFILGSPRSYTSLVCAMLGQHPGCYGVPELNLFTADRLQNLVEEYAGYRQIQLHGLLRTVAQLYGGEQSLLSIDMAHRWILARLQRTTADVYRELCRKVAPLRIVDKSPVYVESVENLKRLQKAFPGAFYLHLVRHPRRQGESVMNVAKGMIAVMANSIDYSTEPPTVDPQISWYEVQRNISGFLKRIPPERQLCMRGEDVLNGPREKLSEVCRWLGIDHGERALDDMLHPERSPFASLGPVGAHLGNDLGFLKSPAFRPGSVDVPALDGPVPWRGDGQGLQDRVIAVARELGYR
jgi:hypothetical protein